MNPLQVKEGTFTLPSTSSSSKVVDVPIGFKPDWIRIISLQTAVSTATVVGLEWIGQWASTKHIIKDTLVKEGSVQTLGRVYVASSSSYYLQGYERRYVSTTSSASVITAVQHKGDAGIRFPNAAAKALKGKSFYYIALKASKVQAHGALTGHT